jgi:hypothetical protein
MREMDALMGIVDETLAQPDETLRAMLDTVPEQAERIRAMLVLSHVGERLVAPIFALTDAVGSVMRKKIEPVTRPVLDNVDRLRS